MCSINTCGCIISNEISGHAHTNMYLPPMYSENKSLGTYCVQCIAKINNLISDLSTSSWKVFFLFFHIAANNWQDWSIMGSPLKRWFSQFLSSTLSIHLRRSFSRYWINLL